MESPHNHKNQHIFSVPIIENAYKSYRMSFFEGKYKCTVSCEG